MNATTAQAAPTPKGEIDPITFTVIWNSIVSIAEELGTTGVLPRNAEPLPSG